MLWLTLPKNRAAESCEALQSDIQADQKNTKP